MRRKWKWGTRWWKIWRQPFALSQWGESISPSTNTLCTFSLLQTILRIVWCDPYPSCTPTIWRVEEISHILNPVNFVTCYRKDITVCCQGKGSYVLTTEITAIKYIFRLYLYIYIYLDSSFSSPTLQLLGSLITNKTDSRTLDSPLIQTVSVSPRQQLLLTCQSCQLCDAVVWTELGLLSFLKGRY